MLKGLMVMNSSKDYEFIVDKDSEIRLDKFLVKSFSRIGIDVTRSKIEKLLDANLVFISSGKAAKANLVCKQGWVIKLNLSLELSSEDNLSSKNILAEDLPFDIVYEDADILVVNKTANFVVHPGAGNKTGTLLNAVKYYLINSGKIKNPNLPARLGLVHRLDKDTTGLILFAKSQDCLLKLNQQFLDRSINKQYLALVYLPKRGANILRENDHGIIETTIGRDPKNRLKMMANVGTKLAKTQWSVIERLYQAALVQIILHTGRTHQIRVHMSSIGCPIMQDALYGDLNNKLEAKVKKIVEQAGHQLLHAWKLTFSHPKTNKTISLEAPIPVEFTAVVENLRNV